MQRPTVAPEAFAHDGMTDSQKPPIPAGIVVRNTFIDVCPLEEESDGDGEGSCASPQRRNLSAPPSPTRFQLVRSVQGAIDSDQEEEEDPGAIPNYQWADGGLVTAEGVEHLQDAVNGACNQGDAWVEGSQLPTWLQKPPGSPKKVPERTKKGRTKGSEGQPRPALGEFLKGGASPWGRGCSAFSSVGSFSSSPWQYEQDLWQDRGPPPFAQGFGPSASQLPDHAPGAAYISDNPPPRDPLGGHIPTEAPAYILGSSRSATASAPVLASQPLPPQQAMDASRNAALPAGTWNSCWSCAQLSQPGARYDSSAMPSYSACRLVPGDGGGYPDVGPAHGSGHYPMHRGIAAGAGAVGPLVAAERPRHSSRGGGTAATLSGSLAVGGSTGSSLPQSGHSGPWVSPSAMQNMPWLSPSAAGAVARGGVVSDSAPSGQARSGKGAKGSAIVSDASSAGGKGEVKGRVPLAGGGPKRTDYIKKYGAGETEGNGSSLPITTMMLKNIPCRKSQEEVMLHIDGKGFSNRYDFFYLPRDVKFRANLGYAFINFLTPEDASGFENEMNGYRFTGSGSTKACAVVPAHVQGLLNNLAAFKRTEVMRSSRKPYFSSVVTL